MLTKAIDAYFALLKGIVVLCLMGMVVLVFGNVLMRYIFNSGITVSEEFARWLFVWLTFIGAIIVLRDHGHLGLDFVVNSLPRPLRRICLVVGHLLMILATWLIIDGSWTQASVNFHTYAPATGLSMGLFFGVGLIFGISTMFILVWRLFLIATGQMDRMIVIDEETAAVTQGLEK
ncbi:TRAP transporter small permease [Microvirga sp. ACRRW]|uniref:TRAP transporter small permease n=1 Tax=Microvirga sp. ACRRW TaxID=2918205 RepID=UPI001EF414D0|nr:TRAP transporter small permease [Microvirga sp. ACRRW]MCG7393233.1 TRAP transporter small permease [Microvirga sp. ACRRW]